MVEFLGWVDYNPNFTYFNDGKEKCSTHQKYYMCGNTVYKIEGVDHINSFTNQIFYRGTTVDSNNACVTKNNVFELPEDKHTINEKLFNRIYNEVKGETANSEESQYYYNPTTHEYFKLIRKERECCCWVYYGDMVNTTKTSIEGNVKLDIQINLSSRWIKCSEADYKDALNEVINKIK